MDFNNILPALIALAAVILFTAGLAFLTKRKNRKFLIELEQGFGKVPNREFGLKLDSISTFWYEKKIYDSKESDIDEITWNDLDMDKVYERVNNCCSSAGEEYLYAMLHEPEQNAEVLEKREKIIGIIDEDPSLRKSLQILLSKVGKVDYNSVAGFCYDVSSKRLKNTILYPLLAFFPLLFIPLIFVNPPVGFVGLLLAITLNGSIHYYVSIRITFELKALKYFSAMLWGAKNISELLGSSNVPFVSDLEEAYDTFKKVGGKMSSTGQQKLSDFDSIIEYFQIVSLSSIRNYNKVIDLIENHPQEFRKLFVGIGEIDSALSILSFRKSLGVCCKPSFINENMIETEDIYHPLIKEPVCNTVSIPKYNLISGSNASGKSTFIKAIAINAIMAQTINTCTAKSFSLRFSHVLTSMAIKDDVTSGDSYFIAEIKSLKRIIDAVNNHNCICIIDEILRGTNTIERIAASTSVLQHIATIDCLCIVATHDIELTTLLDGIFQNHHFSEKITDDGVVFDYTIRDGATKTRNAITLLDYLDFDKEITTAANSMVMHFEETKKW